MFHGLIPPLKQILAPLTVAHVVGWYSSPCTTRRTLVVLSTPLATVTTPPEILTDPPAPPAPASPPAPPVAAPPEPASPPAPPPPAPPSLPPSTPPVPPLGEPPVSFEP